MFESNNQGIFNQYRWLISRIQWFLDGAIVVLILIFFCWLYNLPFENQYPVLGGISLILTVLVFHGAQLYRPWRGVGFMRLVRRVFSAWTMVLAILLAIGFVTKTSFIFSRYVLLFWMVSSPIALVFLRLQTFIVLQWARSKGRNSRTIVIAGAGDLGKTLAKNVVYTSWLGMRLLGFFDDQLAGKKIELEPNGEDFPVLGNLDDMIDFIRKYQVNMAYLALPLRAEARLREIIDKLHDTTASVYFVPDVFIFSLFQASLSELRGIPLISLWETPFYGVNAFLKRAEDLFLAILFLIIALPLMLIIALGIKLSSPGPVFFKQRRYGLDGKEIIVYKFRTMTVCEDGPEIPQATRNDQRVTPLGGFLRRTSWDELPQIINVLQGRMSIVGPRPHAVAHNEFYRKQIPGYMLRHKVRPGITGWAQINGWRGETETLDKMEQRLKYDLEYLRHWSLWLDLKIIFQTVSLVFSDGKAF